MIQLPTGILGAADEPPILMSLEMLPLSDGLPARRFPVINVLLLAANLAAWLFYELPHLNAAVYHASSTRAPWTTPATRRSHGG